MESVLKTTVKGITFSAHTKNDKYAYDIKDTDGISHYTEDITIIQNNDEKGKDHYHLDVTVDENISGYVYLPKGCDIGKAAADVKKAVEAAKKGEWDSTTMKANTIQEYLDKVIAKKYM